MPKKINKPVLTDLAAERAVLSALCQYGLDCYLEIDFVTADHFTDEMNQILFHCIYKSISQNSKVELSSILSASNDLGVHDVLNTKEEISFIRSLFNSLAYILLYLVSLIILKASGLKNISFLPLFKVKAIFDDQFYVFLF